MSNKEWGYILIAIVLVVLLTNQGKDDNSEYCDAVKLYQYEISQGIDKLDARGHPPYKGVEFTKELCG